MDTKTVICYNCGKAFPVWDTEGLSYGRGTRYFCLECIREGQRQVDQRVFDKCQKIKKEKEK